MNWVLVTEFPLSLQFADNGMLEMELEGRKFTLAKWSDQYFAFAQKCPHASGRMASGYINAQGQVVCPLHRYAFSPINGRNTTGEGYYLKTYPIEQRPDGLFIGFKPNSFF